MASRRDFLKTAGAVALAVTAAPMLGLESCEPTSYPPVSNTTTNPPSGSDGRVAVDLADLSSTNPAKYATGLMGSDGHAVIITRVSATDFRAFSARCPHAGCDVDFHVSNGTMPCPCHLSLFALDGSVKQGPSVSGLAQYDGVYDATNGQLRVKLT